MTDLPPIVGLAGPKRAGKGTAARALTDAGYQLVSFARPLKDMLIAMGLTERDLDEGKELPHPLLGGLQPRWAMQSLGTEWMRKLVCQDGWVNIARHRIAQWRDKGQRVVVDDCRFDNEGVMLRGLGAPIIEITRPGYAYNPVHASEVGLSRHLIAASIANDRTPEQLRERLWEALRQPVAT